MPFSYVGRFLQFQVFLAIPAANAWPPLHIPPLKRNHGFCGRTQTVPRQMMAAARDSLAV